VHVHTSLSDGGGTPEEVLEAANAAQLDFVAITDHNHMDAFGFEGYHDETLVVVGAELSTTKGHLIGLGLERDPPYRFSGDAIDGLTDIQELEGFPVIAHPWSPRKDLAWTDFDLPGPWGLEILNGDSAWRSAGARLSWTLAFYPINSRFALLRILTRPHAALARWDALLRQRPVLGIYGTDAHGRLPLTETWSVNLPSYDSVFGLARNHVLLKREPSGDASSDRTALIDALRSGRSYIGIDGLAPANGFEFVVESESGERWTMGESLELESGLRARAGGLVPAGARIQLLRNGELLAESVEQLKEPLPGEGVYRVEVLVDDWAVPWILTNPIGVFDPETLAARTAAAAPLQAHEGGREPTTILDDFNAETTFVGGHDAESLLDENILTPEGGVEGGGLRMKFRLAEPTPSEPDVFVALVSWEHRDLSRFEGMTLSIRGDGVYRMWVQVRDENPSSADDGTEWWFASVKTARDWRRVTLPFSKLRSLDPQTDGKIDLDRVRAIVFVIDKGAMKPGSHGTIWIDELGAY